MEHHSKRTLEVYLVYDDLNHSDRFKIEKMFDQFEQRIYFIQLNPADWRQMPVSNHASQANYYRLLMPELLPSTLSRVLYLDCDLVVLTNLNPLWAISLDSFPLAAVANVGAIPEHVNSLGLTTERYFNSGVMLVSLDEWRSRGLTSQCMKVIDQHPEKLLCWDQDALNAVLDGDWYMLKPFWNVQSYAFDIPESELNQLPNKEEILNCRQSIGIVHFTSKFKPWSPHCTHPLRHLYNHYLKKSAWNTPPLRSYLQRLFHRLHSGIA